MPGVKHVVQVTDGVAVVADSWWQARVARDALDIKWDEGAAGSLSSEGIASALKAAAARPGAVFKKQGDADAGLKGAREDRRGRLRAAVPRPRADGADELHGRRAQGLLPDLRPDPVPADGGGSGGAGDGAQARADHRAHHLPRRRLRAAHRRGLHRAGGRDLQGGRRPGQAAVDARRRHDARLLPADQLPPAPGRARRAGPAGGAEVPHDVALGDVAPVPPGGEGRRRPVHDRGGRGALRHPEPARRRGDPRHRACGSATGARCRTPSTRSPTSRSWTSSRSPRARIPTSSAARCSTSSRA